MNVISLPADKRARLAMMAEQGIGKPLTEEWEAAVKALEAGDVKPLLRLPSAERQFLEEEIPDVREQREKFAPTG